MKPTLQRPLIIAAVVWGVVMVAPPLALWQARDRWLERLERPEAQAAWDTFRRDMAEQTGREGPVQRKVPKSPEPPLRVWLRDYFGLAVVAWLSFAGVAGILLLILLWGSIVRPPAGPGRQGRETAPRSAFPAAAAAPPVGEPGPPVREPGPPVREPGPPVREPGAAGLPGSGRTEPR